MADSDTAPWLRRPADQEVADSTGGTTVTVHRGEWAMLAPQLPPEAAAMLAPPVSVSSTPYGDPAPTPPERRGVETMRYRMNMPSGKHRRTRTG